MSKFENEAQGFWTDHVGGSYTRCIDKAVEDCSKQLDELESIVRDAEELTEKVFRYSSYAERIRELRVAND